MHFTSELAYLETMADFSTSLVTDCDCRWVMGYILSCRGSHLAKGNSIEKGQL